MARRDGLRSPAAHDLPLTWHQNEQRVRGWTGRPATPAQFDLNRVRAIGEWGHASRHVGARWEDVGMELLRSGVTGQDLVALLPICQDPSLQSALASTGRKNPDVVLVIAAGEQLALQPADLKWSLDVASYRQISANVLAQLLAKAPRLTEALHLVVPASVADLSWTPKDGFFFCPNSVANQRFLGSPENKRQEYPIESAEVRFGVVEPERFFEPLPGWPTARELARLDGSARGMHLLDTADRYYHLGAGVAGAIADQGRSVFEDEATVDRAGEVDRLRSFLKTVSPPATGPLIDRLGGLMRSRQAHLRELRDLTRAGFSFRDYADMIVQAGLAPEGETESALRRQWSESYRSLLESGDAEIRAAGRRLCAAGKSDAEALEQLGIERDAFSRRLRQRAHLILRDRRAAEAAARLAEPPGVQS